MCTKLKQVENRMNKLLIILKGDRLTVNCSLQQCVGSLMSQKDQTLIITAIGPASSGAAQLIAKACHKTLCLIQESKVHPAGNELAIMFVIKGAWHNLAKFEALIPQIEKKTNISLHFKRMLSDAKLLEGLRYQAQIIAQDRPGILADLLSFFGKNGLQLETIDAQSYTLERSKTPMCTVDFTIVLPLKTHIATLRDKFLSFCEDRNFDALFDPVKIS